MRVVKVIGHLALVEDTYVRIGSTVWRDEEIVSIAIDPQTGYVYMAHRTPLAGSNTQKFVPEDGGYADAKALYERRLALANEGDVNGNGND